MNSESSIRDLVKTYISDNHKVQAVEFMDQLLVIASDFGEVKCGLASDQKLRFDVGNEVTFDVDIGRAKGKLRALCARLAVLCHECGGQDVSPYGGQGFVRERRPSEEMLVAHGQVAGSKDLESPKPEEPCCDKGSAIGGPTRWAVRFMNTASEHHFTIAPTER
jgi:hypothetical protein